MKTNKKRHVGIYAGRSPFNGRLAIEIKPEDTPIGICTSSGTVGPSLSFGHADAVVIIAQSAVLADACATAVGNLIQSDSDIDRGVKFAQKIEGITGVLIIKGEKIGVWGAGIRLEGSEGN